MFSRRTGWNLTKNAFTLALERHQHAGRELFDLTVSNPTRVGLEGSRHILAALAKPEALDYDPQPRGSLRARESVVAYYRALGVEICAEQTILTTSTSEAYSFLFRLLCDPEDEVLIPSPSYPLFEFLADIQDVRLVPYELVYDHGWQIDFHSLRKSISSRTRAVIVVNPNNPTGSYVKAAEQQELNRLCREHELALLADEVFFDFNLSKVKFDSFATNQAALTFTMSGLSKIAGLPQMKVAWIATTGPTNVAEEAIEKLEVIADTYLSVNAPIQQAIPELLASSDDFQQQLKVRLHENLGELDRQLRGQQLCSRLQVEGGWYAILRVPVTRTDEELVIELLELRDVLVHPGHFFNFHADRYLILSLMTTPAVFAEGTKRLLACLNSA
ncbi:MAG TPA: pyridoxal phosphate-dependent aminotransferase [Terriglobales bacterium]|nr:pyridoxal phosphate-dependent aminotransferase [Terriglobales bacterium]